MCKRLALLLTVLLAASVLPGAIRRGLPPAASGKFVQRKTLADVGVTLVSSGVFRFEPGRFFEWRTLEPLPTLFLATPTNWTFAADGSTTTRPLSSDISSVEQIFTLKEMSDFVEKVETEGEPFPIRVKVLFRNGDSHDISLSANGCAKP